MITATNAVGPGDVIRWMEVPQHPGIFALGSFARQVTFSSQQTRAFNLIWALFQTNRLSVGGRVAVVGGGLAGVTATVAALMKGCHVDLYEQASQPCPIQRGNDIRFIHPNILRWPEPGSEAARTDFPFLNWTAANVRGVIKQIDLQWNRYVTNIRRLFNYRVSRLHVSSAISGPQRPWLAANRVVDGSGSGNEVTSGFVESAYDCVILAVGFGEERSVVGVPFLSYWENDSLHQETGRERRSILVSGCGDGGLIDALRLRLRNFDHAAFVRRFLRLESSGEVIGDLQRIEASLRPHALAPDISLRFQKAYDDIQSTPRDVENYFRNEKRSDTSVTLNSPAAGPLSFGSSILNRYATYLAMRYADLHYLSGRVVAERTDRGRYDVTLVRDDAGMKETRQFDLIIVRHGPESTLRHLLPATVMDEMRVWWQTNEDITATPHWRSSTDDPHQFFRGYVTESEPPAQDVLDLALATFEPTYREFIKQPEVESVAVGEHAGKAGFIIKLKAGTPPRLPEFHAGVLVQYLASENAAIPPAPATALIAEPGKRQLPLGTGIYNFDAWERLGRATPPAPEAGRDSYPAGTGTLGCFVRDKEGALHILSSAWVLAPDSVGEIGDRIFREQEGPDNAQPVARLTSWQRPLPEGGRAHGFIDAALAKLEKDIIPDLSAIPSLRGVASAVPGEDVIKIGRTSGRTAGKVRAVALDGVIVTSASGEVTFDDCLDIGRDDGAVFCLSGDGGAMVVSNDSFAVGLLIAGAASGRGIACSFRRVLTALEVELVTPAETPNGPRRRRRRSRRS